MITFSSVLFRDAMLAVSVRELAEVINRDEVIHAETLTASTWKAMVCYSVQR